MKTQATQEHNDKVRSQLSAFVSKYGTTYRYLSKQLGLHDTTISKFSRGIINLSQENLKLIEAYLDGMNA